MFLSRNGLRRSPVPHTALVVRARAMVLALHLILKCLTTCPCGFLPLTRFGGCNDAHDGLVGRGRESLLRFKFSYLILDLLQSVVTTLIANAVQCNRHIVAHFIELYP